MASFKGKSGASYEFKLNLGVVRRLASECGIDLLSEKMIGRDFGMAFSADLALKAHLLNVPKSLHTAETGQFDVEFSNKESLGEVHAVVTGELASFFQRLGLIAEPTNETNAGSGSTSTNTPPGPGSKSGKASRSAN